MNSASMKFCNENIYSQNSNNMKTLGDLNKYLEKNELTQDQDTL
jgi:hypothetical protein